MSIAAFGAALATVLGASGCTVKSDAPNLVGQDVRLTILHTADLHSRLFPYSFAPGAIDKGLGLLPRYGDTAIVGGIARMATLIYRERASSARVIHLDSGDIFEGAPVFNTFAGEVEMRAMSRIGLNAMALGNHEFDKGALNLTLMKANFGGFPILAANYQFADPTDPAQPKLRQYIAPFTVFNVQGLKVAVIGMGNLSSLQGVIEGGNSLGIQPLETKQAVRSAVNLVRSSVDLVVMISHLGLDEDEGVAQTTNVQDQNPVIDGVDVILGGHLHIVLNPPKDLPRYDDQGNPTGHTVLCHSGAFAKYFGRLDLVVHVADPAAAPPIDADGGVLPYDPSQDPRKSYVKSYTYKLFPIDDTIQEDPDMANMLEPYQFKMNTALNLTQSYAVIPCPPTAATCPKVLRNDPDGGDSQLGNLVASAMRLRKRVEADFGLTNSLGIRADFESGPLNLEELYNVFPFDNTITTIELSGNEIQQTLDFVASRSAERGCKSQTQVSGLWFIADCAHRIACGPFDRMGKPVRACTADRGGGPCNADSDCRVDYTCMGANPSATPAVTGVCHRTGPDTDGPYMIGDACVVTDGTGTHPRLTAQGLPACRAVVGSQEFLAAVNDYIASGGSGFAVFKRNTSKYNTGISLRDALADYISAGSKRCAPADYTNINVVRCKTDSGVYVDCSADCCCHDPMGSPNVCITGCDKFTACKDAGKQPRVFDYSGLPCLDNTIESSERRIQMVGGH